MKCQILFSRKIKKNNTNLSSAELAHRVVTKVNIWLDLQEIVVLLTVEKGIEMKGLFEFIITETRLFKYTENFTTKIMKIFR